MIQTVKINGAMVALLTLALVGMTTVAQPAQPADTGRVVEGVHSFSGIERRFRLFVPAKARSGARLPLLVMLHGCTQTADEIARGTRLDSLAATAGVLVLYPEQPAELHPMRCWNWYDPAHQARGSGEPAMLASLTRRIAAEYEADSSRVFIAGVSAGGAMAVNTALAYPDLFAAVASHSGIVHGLAKSVPEALALMRSGAGDAEESSRAIESAIGGGGRPMPVLLMHGARDPVVSFGNTERLAAAFVLANGRVAGQVAGQPKVISVEGETNGYRYTRRRSDTSGAVVEWWIVEELGHAWSGGSPDGTYTNPSGPDASAEMLRFFRDVPPMNRANR